MGPLLYGVSPGEIVQIRWGKNLEFLSRALRPSWNEVTYSFGMESAVGLFLLYLLLIIVRLGLLDGGRWAALSLAHFVLYLSILIFASLRETRVLLEFLPLIVFGHIVMGAKFEVVRQVRALGA